MEKNFGEFLQKMNLHEYKREKLKELNPNEEKGIYREDKLNKILKNIFPKVSEHIPQSVLEFYYYNCEGIGDLNWGCAWRCIQTMIATIRNILADKNILNNYQKLKNFNLCFKNMFMKYGSKEVLEKLFLKSYGKSEIPLYLKERIYAPFDTSTGWAEPFFAKLILSDFGFDGELFLLNSYSKKSYAPIEVFSKTIVYREFKEILISHFQYNPYSTPIIFDDSTATLCIIGASINQENNDNLNLLIADPHVRFNDSGDSGIYSVILNKDGNFTYELNPQKTICGRIIKFEEKPFMIYIPKINQIISYKIKDKLKSQFNSDIILVEQRIREDLDNTIKNATQNLVQKLLDLFISDKTPKCIRCKIGISGIYYSCCY